MSTDIKLIKTQLPKIIQSGGSLFNILGSLGKKVIADLSIPLARNNLHGLVSNLISDAINKFARKISRKRAVK